MPPDQMIALHMNVATLVADMRNLREDVTEIKESLPKITERVDQLERDKIKLVAISTGGGMVFTALLWAAEKLQLFVVLLGLASVLGSCAHDADEARGGNFYWPASRRPVTVLVDTTMPDQCVESTIDAVRFWTDYVDYLEALAVAAPGLPHVGEVRVRHGDLPGDTVGTANRKHTDGDLRLLSVEIVLESCDLQTAAHELGHALGLEHRNDVHALMFPAAIPSSWELSPEELEQIQ